MTKHIKEKKNKGGRILKIVLISLFSVTAIFAAAIKFYLYNDNIIKEKSVPKEIKDVLAKKEEGPAGRVNVLLLGVDALADDRKGDIPRSDTMMLISMDPVMKNGFILSIPRDSRVKLDGRDKYTKINHAHRFGGPELSIKTVTELLGVPIHHYVVVDYQALFKTVDDIGGVDVMVDKPMKYTDNECKPPLHIDFPSGMNHLDGTLAMGYLRFRKGKGYDGSDEGRIERQQRFMTAVIDKLLSPASIAKIPKFAETAYKYVSTDMSKQDILSLAMGFSSLKAENIIKDKLPGEAMYINRVSYYVVDDEVKNEQMQYLMASNYSDFTPTKFHDHGTIDSRQYEVASSERRSSVKRHQTEEEPVHEETNELFEERKLEEEEKEHRKNTNSENNPKENEDGTGTLENGNIPENNNETPENPDITGNTTTTEVEIPPKENPNNKKPEEVTPEDKIPKPQDVTPEVKHDPASQPSSEPKSDVKPENKPADSGDDLFG